MQMRAYIQAGRYPEALELLAEMEEMSKEDKINKIESFLQILLLHLIKQHAEKRTTASWDVSILGSLSNIRRVNKRRNAKGFYVTASQMEELIDEAFPDALRYSSLEAFEGRHDVKELSELIDSQKIKKEAIQLIAENEGL